MSSLSRMDLGGSSSARKMNLSEFYKFAENQNGRWEFVDGIPVALASPSDLHQAIVGELGGTLWSFFKGKRCQYRPGMDVKLFDVKDTIYVPDLLVFCEPIKSDGQRVNGAPELVIEVWSPSNKSWERDRKRSDYKKACVREIWEVSPDTKTVRVWHLPEDGDYIERDYMFGVKMPSMVFSELVFDLSDFV